MTFDACRRVAMAGGLMLLCASVLPASAQTAAPEEGRWSASFTFGWDPNTGGHITNEGAGVFQGLPVETVRRSWDEAFEPGLSFRLEGAYGLDDHQEVLATVTWWQAESNAIRIGNTVTDPALPAFAVFEDYQGWSIEGGYRYFARFSERIKPFGGGSIGFGHVNEMTATLALPTEQLAVSGVKVFKGTTALVFRVEGGARVALTDRFGGMLTLGLKYTGAPAPAAQDAGLAVGFDDAYRWSTPIMVGAYVKF